MNTNPVMQVFTGDTHDVCHMFDQAGAYEWWYVDALSENADWGFVAIMFRGMPMSPDYLRDMAQGRNPKPVDHCGFAVNVYYKGKRLFQVFRGVDAADTSFSTSTCDVRVGACALRRIDVGTWHLDIDTRHPSTSRGLVLAATVRRTGRIVHSDAECTAAHGWVLAAPLATIQARMEVHDVGGCRSRVHWSGMAYHDHNMGRRAMQEDFRSWYWGRALQPDHGFVYLATPDASTPFAYAARVDAFGVHPWHGVQVQPQRHSTTYMALRAARRVVIHGDEGHVDVQQRGILDDGPFYRRYLATVSGDIPSGYAITEDMHVQRYRAAWIRPFLRTPWTRS